MAVFFSTHSSKETHGLNHSFRRTTESTPPTLATGCAIFFGIVMIPFFLGPSETVAASVRFPASSSATFVAKTSIPPSSSVDLAAGTARQLRLREAPLGFPVALIREVTQYTQ
jgi:hypothetical protein